MSIQVICPNGHTLRVKSEMAGRAGLCPVCKARVEVPAARPDPFSEDSLMDLLGPSESPSKAPSKPEELSSPAKASTRRGDEQLPNKACYKCQKEIPLAMTICPHCHTFIGNLRNS